MSVVKVSTIYDDECMATCPHCLAHNRHAVQETDRSTWGERTCDICFAEYILEMEHPVVNYGAHEHSAYLSSVKRTGPFVCKKCSKLYKRDHAFQLHLAKCY